jgi:tRNA(Ile)-lysidine synthase
MSIESRVGDFIRDEGLLIHGQRVVAGVSGGPDSLCLLDCLHRLGYEVIVAHLDHQLRAESPKEAAFVREVAASYGLQAFFSTRDVREDAKGGISLEEAARLARYRFLTQTARKLEVDTIATGHTADDQVETVLMHFIRGAGQSGLRGMLPSTRIDRWLSIPEGSGIRLVRPLLEITREETLAHCEMVGWVPIQDPSNLDPAFFRNRLRHELLPILETYNPGIRLALRRMAQLMAGNTELITELLEARKETLVNKRGEGALAISVELFTAQPTALQRALLREAIIDLKPELRDLGFDAIERCRGFIHSRQRNKRHTISSGLELVNVDEVVVLQSAEQVLEFPEFPQLLSETPIPIAVPGRTDLALGWWIEATIEETPDSRALNTIIDLGGRVAAMDVDPRAPLLLRPRRPGDRIRPLGMVGTTKIADVFINQHIPQAARARWPIVTSAECLAWIVGIRLSEDVRITDETKRFVLLSLHPPKDQ